MVELRWAMPASTTTKAPRLQWRQCGEWPAAWSEWVDAPYVVVKDGPPKPASASQIKLTAMCTCRDGYRHPPCPAHAGVMMVQGSSTPRPPCTVCGVPYEQHGTAPTCASHDYSDGHCRSVGGLCSWPGQRAALGACPHCLPPAVPALGHGKV